MRHAILDKKHILKQAQVSSLSPTLPDNVHLHRGTSTWLNHEVMADWIACVQKRCLPM